MKLLPMLQDACCQCCELCGTVRQCLVIEVVASDGTELEFPCCRQHFREVLGSPNLSENGLISLFKRRRRPVESPSSGYELRYADSTGDRIVNTCLNDLLYEFFF